MRPESLQDYAAFLKRQTFLVLLVAILLGGTVVAVGLRLPRTYAASVVLEVEDTSMSPTSLLPNVVQSALGSSADPVMLHTMIGRLGSRSLLERVIQNFDEAHPTGAQLLPPVPHLAPRIRPSVEVGARLIRLGVELRESEGGPRNAALLANTFAETFRNELAAEETDEQRHEAQTQLRLLDVEKGKFDTLLDGIQQDLLSFAATHGNPTLWAAELEQLLARQDALRAERQTDQLFLDSIDAVESAAARAIETEPEMLPSARAEVVDPVRTSISSQILVYEATAAERAGAGLSQNAPELQGINQALKHLGDRLDERPERVTADTYTANRRREWMAQTELETTLDRARAEDRITRLDALLAQIDQDVKRRAEEIPQSQVQFDILREKASALHAVYESLLLRQTQTEIALGAAAADQSVNSRTIGGLAIVDPARPELRPIRPRVLMLLVAGVALGLLSGLAAGLTAEWRASAKADVDVDHPA